MALPVSVSPSWSLRGSLFLFLFLSLFLFLWGSRA